VPGTGGGIVESVAPAIGGRVLRVAAETEGGSTASAGFGSLTGGDVEVRLLDIDRIGGGAGIYKGLELLGSVEFIPPLYPSVGRCEVTAYDPPLGWGLTSGNEESCEEGGITAEVCWMPESAGFGGTL
jgi:hypothetical protein